MTEAKKIIIKILSWVKAIFLKIDILALSKTFKPKYLTNKSAFLDRYSVINDENTLELLRKICFTDKDVRAGWLGAGLPKTEEKSYQKLADWATEHLFIYFSFFPYLKDAGEKKEILDVGSGIGFATVCLAELWPKSNFVGIDYDKEAVRVARLFNHASNVTYLEKDFFQYKSRKTYDYIFALEVMEHVPASQHDELIKKCMALLAPEGKLFISTPNALDAKDDSYSHIGLLNRKRAKVFIRKYRNLIREGFFIDNKKLLTKNPSKFIVKRKIEDFEDENHNLSHFHLVMSKKSNEKIQNHWHLPNL